METGKQGFVSVTVLDGSISAQRERERMHVQAPLTTMFLHAMPALPPHPQVHVVHPQAAPQESSGLRLSMPPLYSKETLPFLTLNIPGGLQLHQQGSDLGAALSATRPKSAGKHQCPHCGRDCLKPSVLEKHLRCHTGERPYPCIICGVSFKTQSNLYKHKRTQTHARLCSESEQSSLGSQDSLHSSRDTCNSSLSLDVHSEDSGSQGMEVSAQHTPAITSARSVSPPTGQVGADTGWALQQAALVGLLIAPGNDLKVSLGQDAKTSQGRSDPEETKEGEKEKRLENEKPLLTQNRHLPLQRQEATLFSKQWGSSMSKGKSQQSHDSTDSGFGESSEHPWTSSPGSMLPDHGTDSCTESSLELHKQVDTTACIPTEPGPTAPESKASVSEQEQRKLEERISKLISENDAVVVDKHLENVRPRKTMLSKQGSIDLPMPYTYKDSFHFEMRTTRPSNLSWQRADRGGRQALFNSAPTQYSTSLEHAPLTRSSSLPFSVGIQQSERSGTSYPHHRDFITLARRGSSGLIYPAGFATKSVDQQVSNHRPLVRQVAVDCNPAPEGIAVTASTEEVCPNILSSDGDSADICGEPGSRKYRRKKTQKFAYNKWYMYGGGTFKKLYSTDNGAETGVLKTRKSVTKLEHELNQGIQRRGSTVHKELVTSVGSATGSSSTVCHQSCLPANLPLVTCVNSHQTASHLHYSCSSIKTPVMKKLSLSTLQAHVGSTNTCYADSTESTECAAERVTHEGNHIDCVSPPKQHCESHIPSERKKQRTDNSRCSLGTQVDSSTSKMLKAPVNSDGTCSSPSVMKTNRTYISMSSFSEKPTATKTSFLPKYQLKLPKTTDPGSGSSTLTLNQPKGRINHNTTCLVSCDQVSTSMTTGGKDTSSSEKRCRDIFTLPLSHTHSKTSRLDSQSKSTSSEKATTHNQTALPITEQSRRARPTLAAVQRQAATNETSVESYPVTTTTAILQGQDAKPHSTLLDDSPVVDFTSATTITASVQNLTAVSTQSQCPALSQAAALSDNIGITEELKPAIPCHIIPYSGSESAAQNVFYVRTADLQICLQIISDEQLAQIEMTQTEMLGQTLPSGLSDFSLAVQGSETRSNPKGTENEDRGYVTQAQESTNTDTGRNITESQNQMDARELSSSPTVTEHSTVQSEKPEMVDRVTPPTKTGQLSHCWHVSSALSDPQLHPGTHRHTLTREQSNRGGVMASLASWKGVKSARSQAQEHIHPLCLLPEECTLPKRLINQTDLISEPLSGQHKLCLAAAASPKPCTVVNRSSGNGLEEDVGQHKCLNKIVTCNVCEQKTKHKTPELDALTLEGMHGESHLPLQACSGQWSNANSNVALSNKTPSFPNSQACDLPGEPDSKQTMAYNVSGLMELKCVNSEIISRCETSSKHAGVESIRVGALDKHLPLQDKSLCKSEDKTPSNHSDIQLIHFTPVPCSIQNDRPKDATGFSLGNQGPATGAVERESLAGCSPQTQEELLSHRTPPWQPDRPDEEPGEHQAAQEPIIQPTEKQQSKGEKERKDARGRSLRRDTVSEQGEGRVEAGGLHTQLKTDALKPEHYEEQHDADSLQNSGLPTQTHQPLSQIQAVLSCNSTQSPQQKTITLNTRQSLPGNGDISVPSTSQLEMETDSSLFPQRLLQVDQPPGMIRQQCQSETSLLCTAKPFHDRETSPTGHVGSTTTCYSSPFSSSKRPKTPSPVTVVKLDSPCSILVSQPDHVPSAPGGMTKDTHPGSSGPTDMFTQPGHTMNSAHTLPTDRAERGELTAEPACATLNNVSARQDSSSKYCSVLSAGQFYSCPLLTSGVRAVQSCVEDHEDTSSSDDDEGKLIIEL